MNKIVCENYPASKLPEDLRPSDDPNARVTVTIEQEPDELTAEEELSDIQRPEHIMSLEEIFVAVPLIALRRRSTPQFAVTETSGMTDAACPVVYLDANPLSTCLKEKMRLLVRSHS